MVGRVLSDIEICFGIANAYKDSSLERGLVGGRDQVGGDGDGPCAVAPTVWFGQIERFGMTICKKLT